METHTHQDPDSTHLAVSRLQPFLLTSLTWDIAKDWGAASSEAFTVAMCHVEVFRVVTPCSVVVGYLHPEDGGSMDLWNVGIIPQHYTESQPRRLCVPVDTVLMWHKWNTYHPLRVTNSNFWVIVVLLLCISRIRPLGLSGFRISFWKYESF
jgi:hypothetical protein